MLFEAVIGLELHIQMKTKSKMFSSAPVSYGLAPNTMANETDLAFPGTMPVVNKQAVINGIRVSHALHMDIDRLLVFDRKNYFYPDLPKGYQITQQERPLGSNGYIVINTSNGEKTIRVERLHLEEDTCKQIHYKDHTLLDYNRAGIPLIEIVSKPDIRTGEEAMKYVEKIKSIVTFLDVSDGKMEEGSLRCDVNISLKKKDSKEYGTKVEIKNLNSVSNVQRAIDFERKRQEEILLNGGHIIQETRRYDETKKETVLMRIKADEVDYKIFRETNIAPIRLSEDFIKECIDTSNELADSKIERYKKLGLSEYDANLITSDKDISNYFDEVISFNTNPKLSSNWINKEVLTFLNKKSITIKEFPITPNELSSLVKLIEDGIISNKQARDIFSKMLDNNVSLKELTKSIDTQMVSDEGTIRVMVQEIIDLNPKSVIDYKNGKNRAAEYLTGQVIKKSGGKVNPSLANKFVLEELKRR